MKSISCQYLLDPHLGQAVAQSVSGQAQQTRGLALIAVSAFQRFANDGLLVLIESHPFRQKSLCADGRAGTAHPSFDFDVVGLDAGSLREKNAALYDILQFAHVAGPVI